MIESTISGTGLASSLAASSIRLGSSLSSEAASSLSTAFLETFLAGSAENSMSSFFESFRNFTTCTTPTSSRTMQIAANAPFMIIADSFLDPAVFGGSDLNANDCESDLYSLEIGVLLSCSKD